MVQVLTGLTGCTGCGFPFQQGACQGLVFMIAGTRAAPVQVGVWIPKAKLGPTADFFRPLGMPNTCDRLLDGTIAAVIMKATCLKL